MNRDNLGKFIESLAKATEDDYPEVAIVLYTLAGAIYDDMARDLAKFVQAFNLKVVEEIKKRQAAETN